jgi:hypothetical protein
MKDPSTRRYIPTQKAMEMRLFEFTMTVVNDGSNGDIKAQNVSTVDAYNVSLTQSTPTTLSRERGDLAATTVGGYALFGGGTYYVFDLSGSVSTVDAYNTSLTRSTPTTLFRERGGLAATTVGNYALFGGGRIYGVTPLAVVEAYNTSLTQRVATA